MVTGEQRLLGLEAPWACQPSKLPLREVIARAIHLSRPSTHILLTLHNIP